MSGVATGDTVESNGGKVLVYERSGASWSLAQTLVSGTPVYGAQFGWSLDLSGERAIVGAFGDVEAGKVSEGVALRSLVLSPGDSTAERVVIPMQAPLESGRYELRLRWSDDAGERVERAYFVPPARNEAALGSVRRQ